MDKQLRVMSEAWTTRLYPVSGGKLLMPDPDVDNPQDRRICRHPDALKLSPQPFREVVAAVDAGLIEAVSTGNHYSVSQGPEMVVKKLMQFAPHEFSKTRLSMIGLTRLPARKLCAPLAAIKSWR
jgi:hypothetical protein